MLIQMFVSKNTAFRLLIFSHTVSRSSSYRTTISPSLPTLFPQLARLMEARFGTKVHYLTDQIGTPYYSVATNSTAISTQGR